MLQDFGKHKITLVKADGTVVKDQVPALVTGDIIFTTDKELPVQIGDYILRHISNGFVEKYEVKNPKYYDVGHGAEAHFQIHVTRAGAPQTQAAVVQRITNTFRGSNSRVNINSSDNSINVSSDISFESLRNFIEQVRPLLQHLPKNTQKIVETEIATIEEEAEKPTPSRRRIFSALQSIKSVAEGASGNIIAAGIINLIDSLN